MNLNILVMFRCKYESANSWSEDDMAIKVMQFSFTKDKN